MSVRSLKGSTGACQNVLLLLVLLTLLFCMSGDNFCELNELKLGLDVRCYLEV